VLLGWDSQAQHTVGMARHKRAILSSWTKQKFFTKHRLNYSVTYGVLTLTKAFQ
jgi:hypothetical protein